MMSDKTPTAKTVVQHEKRAMRLLDLAWMLCLLDNKLRALETSVKVRNNLINPIKDYLGTISSERTV